MFTFPKTEKLCSRKVIQSLFTNGNSFSSYPFRIVWLSEVTTQASTKVVIVVSKRNFKKAVDRNLIKRRVRESYRINKSSLINYCINNNKQLSLSLIYIANEIFDYKYINNKISLIIKKLILSDEKSSN